MKSNQLYAGVDYLGENVCIAIYYDIRERLVECYVGKIMDGQLEVDRKEGGYWAPLERYVVERLNRSVPDNKSRSGSSAFPELAHIKRIIESYGDQLLADSPDAFQLIES